MKKWLKKTVLWLKHHWYIPLSLLAIVVSWVLFRGKAEFLMEALLANREDYKEEKKKIDEINSKQISERNEHITKKNEAVASLQTEHEEKLKELDAEEDALIKDLVNKDLAAEFDKEFNL